MGLLRTMNEVLATARYYQERYDQEMRLRRAEEIKQRNARTNVVTLPAHEAEEHAKAA